MKRFSHLIVLIAVPALFALAVYLQDKPVHAAGDKIAKSGEMALEAEGRDIQVIDGDTIMINGKVVDIAGMDAPELGQQCRHNGTFQDCGMSSAMQLRKYFAMAPFTVQCWPGDPERSEKQGDFPIVECGIGERDVAAAMITDGEALPIPGYSHRYDSLSTEADNAKIGIHGGDMMAPADWRAGKRLDGEDGRCLFVADGKGNYLSTLDPRFADMDTSENSKICSDEEARQKGYSYTAP
ncbi:thermonuclease family protein [Thalassospira lucentensis]|uniref:thermonuclease family protein n=1 Tax=Thalassospira lucentensis TaxID=168935 RepID=UPI00399D6CD8